MNVLSLFDGMSCARIAMIEAGLHVDKYYASEIDKHAIGQTQLNFPDTIQLGSVVDVDVSKLDHIDIVVGGSPCQSFSFAGKRKGMATKCSLEIYTLDMYLELKADGFEFEGQSYLFWEYMRILTDIRKYNPDVLFLLENVEMVAKWKRTLSNAIGVWPVHINSALVSAQNRKRLYWTNIRTRREGLFGDLYSDIPQPKDRGILLKNILETDVDDKYYLSDKMLKSMKLWGQVDDAIIGHSGTGGQKGSIYGVESKMGGLCATDYKQAKQICVSMVGRKTDENGTRKDNDPNLRAVQRLEPNTNGKTNCLTSVQKDNLLAIIQRPRGNNKGSDFTDKSPTLSSSSWEHNNVLSNGFRIRRLTPLEYSRLQTIPDWYKWACSDTQAYRMLGNGWTVDVIRHIFSFIHVNVPHYQLTE